MEKKTVSMGDLSPLMTELLAKGDTVELTVTGRSMEPMLRDGISRVRLAAPRPLHRGDLPLYRRQNGTFVLHRVVEAAETGYVCCGDGQWQTEHGILQSQIVAVVTAYTSNGRWIPVESRRYRLYWQLRLLTRPLRRLLG